MRKYLILICVQILIANVATAQKTNRIYKNELQSLKLYEDGSYMNILFRSNNGKNDTVLGKWHFEKNNCIVFRNNGKMVYKMSKDSLFLNPPLCTEGPIDDSYRLLSQLHLTKYYDSETKLSKEYKYKWRAGKGYLFKKTKIVTEK